MVLNNIDGQVIGQYLIQAKLGQGGMGAVYQAHQTTLKREVALKILPNELAEEPGYLERFNIEAEISASLEHPHIVPILDYGTQQGISYVAMRLLRGGTLHQRLRQRAEKGQRLPTLNEVADLLQKLASALDYAHSNNVIHRDIKPNNIMFDEHGTPYVVDFGIAKLLEGTAHLTSTGMTLGTPSYMPPEQWMSGAVTAATDQYALGILLYELLAGRPPYTADNPFALMHKHVYTEPVPVHEHNPSLPPELHEVVARAIAKEDYDRYPSVTEFASAFAETIANASTQPLTGFFTYKLRTPSAQKLTPETILPDNQTFITPQEPQAVSSKQSRRHKGFIKMVSIAVLVLAIMGVISILGGFFDGDNSENNVPTDVPNPAVANVEETATTTVVIEPSPSITLTALPEATATLALTEIEYTATPVPTESPTEDTSSVITAVSDIAPMDRTYFAYESPLYADDFEGLTENHAVNSDLWQPYIWNDNCTATQSDGILAMQTQFDNSNYNCRLSLGEPKTLGQVGAFSADMMLPDTDIGATSIQGLLITDQNNDRGIYCGLNASDTDEPAIRFLIFEDGGHTIDNFYPAQLDEWYNVRLEIDPVTMQITCLVNGEFLDTSQPTNKDGFRNGNEFFFLIENHIGTAESSIGYVDNVRLMPVTLYDGFNGPDIKWDIWDKFIYDGGCDNDLETGTLVFTNETQDVLQKCALLASQAPDIHLENLDYFAAYVYLNSDELGVTANQGLLLITDDNERSWWAYCGLDTRISGELTQRLYTSDGAIDVSILADFGRWYDVRFEVDTDNLTVSCYADDMLIGEFQPNNTALFDQVGIDFGIENIRTHDNATRGQTDDVRISVR